SRLPTAASQFNTSLSRACTVSRSHTTAPIANAACSKACATELPKPRIPTSAACAKCSQCAATLGIFIRALRPHDRYGLQSSGGLAGGRSAQASIDERIVGYELFLGGALPFRIALRSIGRLFPGLARRRQWLQRRRPVRSGHSRLAVAEVVRFHIVERPCRVLGRLRKFQRQATPYLLIDLVEVAVEGLDFNGPRTLVKTGDQKRLALVLAQVPLTDPHASYTRVHRWLLGYGIATKLVPCVSCKK